MSAVDDETPPSGWSPSEEDLKGMKLATPLDLDAHLRASPTSIQAAETWLETLRGPSPMDEVRRLLLALDQKVEQLDQKVEQRVEHAMKRLESRLGKKRSMAFAEERSKKPGARAIPYSRRAQPAPPASPSRVIKPKSK